MKNFDIYVYEDMDELDFLDAQMNKGRLWICALKIDNYFYPVTFYKQSIISSFFNTSGDGFYSFPNLIIIESITIIEIERAVNYLYENGYFEHLKHYKSFESIKFYIGNKKYKGKLLRSIVGDVHK